MKHIFKEGGGGGRFFLTLDYSSIKKETELRRLEKYKWGKTA